MIMNVTPRKHDPWLIVCCICFAFIGWHIAKTLGVYSGVNKHQTLSAATLSDYQARTLPLDLQLAVGQQVQSIDTVKVHDTVYVPKPEVVVINKKSQMVHAPKGITDYVYLFRNAPQITSVTSKAADREEDTAGNVDSPKESTIQLIVNGDTVFSKNVNHSPG